jgi:pyruvate/2-oxoglutarate dehydrogenase complex dihydrolipoamide acyltransferase (E2) component
MSFHKGDLVKVNGLEATIEAYDEAVNQLVYSTPLAGGATNTTYAHISNSHIELVEAAAPAQAEELPLAEAPNPNDEN